MWCFFCKYVASYLQWRSCLAFICFRPVAPTNRAKFIWLTIMFQWNNHVCGQSTITIFQCTSPSVCLIMSAYIMWWFIVVVVCDNNYIYIISYFVYYCISYFSTSLMLYYSIIIYIYIYVDVYYCTLLHIIAFCWTITYIFSTFFILPRQDYLLEDAPSVYYALFREMAHLAAWDHQGRTATPETYLG